MATETSEQNKARLQAEAKARAAEQRRRREAAAVRDAERAKKDAESRAAYERASSGMKRGGKVKKYARGGGIESKGKTRGRFV